MIGVLLFLIIFILMCVFLGPVGFVLGLGLGLAIAFAKFTGGLLAFWSEARKRKSEKECPHCCEQIPKDATVCKYCGRDTRGELNQPKKDLVPGSSMDQAWIEAWIEEFVYKFNKTVTNISNNPGQPVDDYGVLISFFETIKEKSLDTPLIKGLENKSAFEQVLLKAQNLLDQLSKNPQVQTHLGQQEEARVKKD